MVGTGYFLFDYINEYDNATTRTYYDNVYDNDGKVLTPVYWRRWVPGYGYFAYEWGFAYKTDKSTAPYMNEVINISKSHFSARQKRLSGPSEGQIIAEFEGSPINQQGNSDFLNHELGVGVITASFTGTNSALMSILGDIEGDQYREASFGNMIDLGTFGTTEFWNNVLNVPAPKLPFETDTSKPGGGDGVWDDDSSDVIKLPSVDNLNSNSINQTKFFTCYKMSMSQLTKLSTELWSSNIFTQLSNTVIKPTDFVVSLNMIPLNVAGTNRLIKAGQFLLNGAEGTVVNTQYVRLECGEVTINKKWGGAIDYQTDISLFLPYVGVVELGTNDVMGATVGVYYTVDIMTGNFICSIRVVREGFQAILYQYNGNCAANYPITSADFSTIANATLGLTMSMATKGASPISALSDTTSNLLSGGLEHPTRSGSLGGSAGFMGIKKPYLIISRPIQSLADNYNSFRGYVSNINCKLSDCKGYTLVDKVHLDNIPCLDVERTALEAILKSGIII